ncbi:MAG TPA: DNA repair and recombination protein RadA, partial [Candidatus Nanoarchaeia archaeon]|nr:DNA repair and recombination protein RadA [Candidatus Nanoarchaeia archaeon]
MERVVEVKVRKLAIQDLPGVGAATAEKLESAGYRDLMA